MDNDYYLVVGERYRSERHPLHIHPDGYATIKAANYEEAKTIALTELGDQWAYIYAGHVFRFRHHPLGSMATITRKLPPATA